MSTPRGVSALGVSASGGVCSGGCLVETSPEDTAAGGTHPTGMHSCFITRLRL